MAGELPGTWLANYQGPGWWEERRPAGMASTLINTCRAPDGSLMVEVRGEVDVQNSARLRDILVNAATQQMPARIMVDLLHVTFIDSTGIGALAAGCNAAQRMGLGFGVRHPNAFVVAQLRQTGLYDTLVGGRGA